MGGVTGKLRDLLLRRNRVVMLAVAVAAALLVGSTRLIDEGEIVKVTTYDGRNREQVTELWIVDLEDGSYLRAAAPDAAWLARVRDRPEITLQRDGARARLRAVPSEDEALRQRVNAAMAEKYGFADRLWASVSHHDQAVPIRLAPADVAAQSP